MRRKLVIVKELVLKIYWRRCTKSRCQMSRHILSVIYNEDKNNTDIAELSVVWMDTVWERSSLSVNWSPTITIKIQEILSAWSLNQLKSTEDEARLKDATSAINEFTCKGDLVDKRVFSNTHISNFYYTPLGSGVLWSVCLSVCASVRVSVCLSVSISLEPLDQSCNTLCASGFMDDVTFGRNGLYGDAWKV